VAGGQWIIADAAPQIKRLVSQRERIAMDWKILIGTFFAIFFAELGDKTQLAAFSLAASEESRLSVFLGAALALVTATLLAVLLGATVARVVPMAHVRTGAGVLFIVMGILLIAGLL
jgi:putative Ca2+/H+ antiporter (TMEM165/GDT1 family)